MISIDIARLRFCVMACNVTSIIDITKDKMLALSNFIEIGQAVSPPTEIEDFADNIHREQKKTH